MPEVELQDVYKNYHPAKGVVVEAAKGVSVAVEKGELMVLVGPSGCGKTTLLRIIAGLESVTSGTVQIGEDCVNDTPPKDRDVAMVFQNYALFPHLTVRENIGFGLKFRRVPKEEIQKCVMEAARLLRLEDVLDRKPKALSGGQKQRTALGRALTRRPRVFLLDEPLSNLDAQMRAEMRAEIARLHARLGATMIYVTHDQTEAMTLGQRLCVLNEGRVMQIGTPLEVYRQPRNMFVAGFLGNPGMNFLPGKLANENGQWVFENQNDAQQKVRLALESEPLARLAASSEKEVVLGIRPEDLEILPDSASASQDCMFESRIEVCEPLGHETLVHLNVENHPMIARVATPAELTIGQKVRMRCRLENARFFDPETQDALV